MARSRNIKPGFFTNDLLAEIDPLGRLLFAGLWTIADREGRLLDRPKKIKAELLPYDAADADALLNDLTARGFLVRYSVADVAYIQVVNWGIHQSPHVKESPSELPAPASHQGGTPPPPTQPEATHQPAPDKHGADTVLTPDEHECSRPDSLNLIPDSLNLGSTAREAQPKPPPKPKRAAAVLERSPEESTVLAILVKVPGFPPDIGDETTERLRDIAGDFEGVNLIDVAKSLKLKGQAVKNGWLTFRNWVRVQHTSDQEHKSRPRYVSQADLNSGRARKFVGA